MTILHLPVERRDDTAGVSSQDLIHRTGITYRQLDYWTRTGLLRAHVDDPGSGIARGYPLDQVHRAATLSWLLNAGLTLQMCRLIIDELLQVGHVELTDGLVIYLPDEP